jgi:hypothetical protein
VYDIRPPRGKERITTQPFDKEIVRGITEHARRDLARVLK